MNEPKYINNNHFQMLCGTQTCQYMHNDRCTAPTLNGTVPYTYKGVNESEEKCEQFKMISSPFYNRR